MSVCNNCGVEIDSEEGLCNLCMMFPKGREEHGDEDPYFRDIYFNYLDFNRLTPDNIQSCRQNIPELIVQDCIKEFDFNEEQAEKLRMILLVRGVNKWFYARRRLIKLRLQIKEMIKSKDGPYGRKDLHKVIENIYVEIQNIAKMPRWIYWPKTITHKWFNIERKIIIKGKHS